MPKDTSIKHNNLNINVLPPLEPEVTLTIALRISATPISHNLFALCSTVTSDRWQTSPVASRNWR